MFLCDNFGPFLTIVGRYPRQSNCKIDAPQSGDIGKEIKEKEKKKNDGNRLAVITVESIDPTNLKRQAVVKGNDVYGETQ